MNKKYMVLEIGNSAYTEFLTKDGYKSTCDAILIDELYANSSDDAISKVIRINSNRVFDKLITREIIE